MATPRGFTDSVSELCAAARLGRLRSVQQILEFGTPVDSKDELGWTALIWACRAGQIETVEFLLDRGADVFVEADESPLLAAISGGHGPLVELLITRYPSVLDTELAYCDKVALLRASGSPRVRELLVRRLGEVCKEQPRLRPPVVEALPRDDKLVRLIDRASLEKIRGAIHEGARINVGHTPPVIAACFAGRLDVLTLLIQAGADIAYTGDGSKTLLTAAAAGGHLDVVRYLVEHLGADISERDNNRDSPIRAALRGLDVRSAVGEKRAAVARWLLQRADTGDDQTTSAALGIDTPVLRRLRRELGLEHPTGSRSAG